MPAKLTHDLTVDSGRCIRVYDDVFEHWYQGLLYEFAKTSFFRIGWADSQVIEQNMHRSLHSPYSAEDVQRLGILDYLQQTPLSAELDGHELDKAVLNLSTPSDVNFIHNHGEDRILLVYINRSWQDGWHGETLFYSDNKKDIVFAGPYTPNRVIVFDPKIPHTIRPQSYLAPFYRFTLALVFKKTQQA